MLSGGINRPLEVPMCRIVTLLILLFILPAWSAAAPVDGNKAADSAVAALKKLSGFTVTYVGESSRSENRPEITIGYDAPDMLSIKIPAMKFHASHENGLIRILSGDQAVTMNLSDVQKVSGRAQQDLQAIPWLGMPDPAKSFMHPQLSFNLNENTLDIGISFGDLDDPFSWITLMRSGSAEVSDDGVNWEVRVKHKTGNIYTYLIAKKDGILREMKDERGTVQVRKLTLADLKVGQPDGALFTQVFPSGAKPTDLKDSATQRAQILIDGYSGVQDWIVSAVLPKWNELDTTQRKAIAKGISTYWTVVFQDVFASQGENLKKAVNDPKFAEAVNKRTSNKQAFDAFIEKLPAEQKPDAKKLWVDQVLGLVGYQLLDPFVGWTRDRYIVPARQQIAESAEKYKIDAKEQEMLLATLSLPMIDACYLQAESIVIPKILPMIQEAAAGLE